MLLGEASSKQRTYNDTFSVNDWGEIEEPYFSLSFTNSEMLRRQGALPIMEWSHWQRPPWLQFMKALLTATNEHCKNCGAKCLTLRKVSLIWRRAQCQNNTDCFIALRHQKAWSWHQAVWIAWRCMFISCNCGQCRPVKALWEFTKMHIIMV